MTEPLTKIREQRVIVSQFDESDWRELLSREPEGYWWREEAYIAGEEYFEQDKEYLRSN